MIYADFETINLPSEHEPDTARKSFKYQKQVPCAVGYKIVSHPGIEKKFNYKAAVGQDCHKWFIREMLEREPELMEILDRDVPMNLNKNEVLRFEQATKCYLCHKPFNPHKPEDKVNTCFIYADFISFSLLQPINCMAGTYKPLIICRFEIMITSQVNFVVRLTTSATVNW